MILEARHVRGAVADQLAHDIGLPAKRCLGEQWAIVPAGGDLRSHVADHAGLGEQVAAEQLLVAERVLILLGMRALRAKSERCQHKPRLHECSPDRAPCLVSRAGLLQAYDAAPKKG